MQLQVLARALHIESIINRAKIHLDSEIKTKKQTNLNKRTMVFIKAEKLQKTRYWMTSKQNWMLLHIRIPCTK